MVFQWFCSPLTITINYFFNNIGLDGFFNGFEVIQPLPFNDFQPQDHCFQWVFDGFLIWITLTSCSSGGVYSVPGHKAAAMKPLVFPHCPLCELHRCCDWTSAVLNVSSRHNIWLHKKVGDLPWDRQTYSNHPQQTNVDDLYSLSKYPFAPVRPTRGSGWKIV